jgi:hypothetical protein
MKKKTLGILLISAFLCTMLPFSLGFVGQSNFSFAFSTQETVIVEDTLTRSYRYDWYEFTDVQPGLMSVSAEWDNSYTIRCYISTAASSSYALAYGTAGCSYDIQTAGTYYVGFYLLTPGRVVDTPYTGTIMYYSGSTPNDTTPPSVSITSPANGATVSGIITITATASDADSGIDYLACNFGGSNLGDDSSSPYSWTFNTDTLTDGTYTISVTAYDVAGNSAVDSITLTTDNGNTGGGEGEKIFVCFWASDAGTQNEIDKYWSYLQLEGYTKLFNFKDTANFEADFATVEAYEDPEDTIFFYLFGHGNNNGEDSLTAFAPGTSVVYSSELRVMFDTLDAERIGYLIESCHSGGFPLDFQAEPYLAMSTSDEDHNSYALGALPGEGKFSYYFFEHVYDGYTAVESFYYAENIVISEARNSRFAQYPIIVDYSTYVWFA